MLKTFGKTVTLRKLRFRPPTFQPSLCSFEIDFHLRRAGGWQTCQTLVKP
jgi:hypothetical protein